MRSCKPFSMLAAFALTLAAGACSTARPVASGAPAPPAPAAPRRVILIIGDGVGLAQWSVGLLAAPDAMAISRLPEIGLVDTRCDCGDRTTDSAAGATAYAIGARTFNGALSVVPDSTPRTTALEYAEAAGLATGLVTTTSIVDATPAAFASHVPSRGMFDEIASQMGAKPIEVILGGGRRYFEAATRQDRRDLLGELRRRATVVTTPAEFDAAAPTGPLVGLFAAGEIGDTLSLRPSLPAMASKALAVLDRDPEGFFLLLESELTDERGHANVSFDSLAHAVRELDATVQVALDYQARNPETLIVVTGDHETGALMVDFDPRTRRPRAQYGTRGHSSTMLPLFAGGPGAERFGRILTNAAVGNLLRDAVAPGAKP